MRSRNKVESGMARRVGGKEVCPRADERTMNPPRSGPWRDSRHGRGGLHFGMPPPGTSAPFWSRKGEDLLVGLGSSLAGLTTSEAAARLRRQGPNVLGRVASQGALALLLRQFRSPISLLLLVTAILSGSLGEPTDAAIILAILAGSGLLGFWQERHASLAIEELLALIRIRACVRRDGQESEIPIEEVVPGDLVVLNAGDLVPADGRVVEATALALDEGALTGESLPAAKDTAAAPGDAPLTERSCALFMGAHVVAGTALVLVAAPRRAPPHGHRPAPPP